MESHCLRAIDWGLRLSLWQKTKATAWAAFGENPRTLVVIATMEGGTIIVGGLAFVVGLV